MKKKETSGIIKTSQSDKIREDKGSENPYKYLQRRDVEGKNQDVEQDKNSKLRYSEREGYYIDESNALTPYEAYYNITYPHFERRDKLNGEYPTYEEVTVSDSEWIKMSNNKSVLHSNGIGERELKFVHPDGREVVFDGDTHKLVTDPKYKGTYNHHNASNRDKGEVTAENFISDRYDDFWHGIYDVVPYYILGKRNEREQ